MCKSITCLVTAVLCFGFISTASGDLVALYQFDKDFKDTAGNPRGPFDLTVLSGSPEVIDGKLVLKSAEQDTLTMGNKYPGSHPNLSFAVWLNVARSTGTDMRLMGKNDGSGDTPGWNVMVRCGADAADSEQFDIRPALEGVGVGANWGNSILLADAYVVGQWIHLAFTWDGATKIAKSYVNGVLVNTSTMAAGCDAADTIDEFLLGRCGWGVAEWYDGMVDDLAIWDNVLTDAEVSTVYTLGPIPRDRRLAFNPGPADQATDVPMETVLQWGPGESAAAHDVYIGTVFNDVNTAARSSPLLVSQGQADSTYDPPGRLAFGTTYYWRVDEVNAPPTSTIFKGSVWSFTTEPVAYPVDGKSIKATASSADLDQGPENTINNSGLTNDLHSEDLKAMWLTAPDATGPAWIQYEFDRVLRLDHLWVWNHNGLLERMLGLGAKSVIIEYSTNGVDYTTLGTTHEFARAPGKAGYASNTTIDLGGIAAKYVKLTITSNWGGILTQYGLSEVRFFSVPVFARQPSPVSGAANVDINAGVSWRAGREAIKHSVYLSTDKQAVIDGTVAAQTVTSTAYVPALNLASTYYWRVDEANEAKTPPVWQGDLWSFSTQTYAVVDDFESYTNDSPNRLFQAWIDGAGFSPDEFFPQGNAGNGSGALVGYDPTLGPIVETKILHAGKKAMPLIYDNTTSTYSEARRTFSSPQDWSQHGIKALTLWFYGDSTNTVQQMYVKINSTKVPYDGAAENLKRKQWQMWYIPLASLNVSSVTSLSIGLDRLGTVGGPGKVLIDDIRLYAYDRQLVTPKDPGTAGLQARYQFEGNANDSSGKTRNGTVVGAPLYVEGKSGQAISLDGFDDYVNIDGYKGVLADAAGVQQAVTVCAWVKTTVDGDIVSWGTNAGGQRMCFRVDTVIRVEHGSGNIRGTNGPSLRDDEWHHVAATVPQAGRMMDVRLYTDGADATATSTTTAAFNIKANVDVRIGMGGPTGGRFLKALIDDVRIYDRVLSAEEIAWLAGRTIPFDTGF